MQLGFVGLGKMGGNMVHRIHRDSDHQVVAFDFSEDAVKEAEGHGASGVSSLEDLVGEARGAARGVDHGAGRRPHAGDGGQARRAARRGRHDHRRRQLEAGRDDKRAPEELAPKGIDYVDVGTSRRRLGPRGGLLHDGRRPRRGGRAPVADPRRAGPAAHRGARARAGATSGRPGAGHYVKMVHNGVEYGIMQAYAEGFALFDKPRVRARQREDRPPLDAGLGGPLLALRAGRLRVRAGGQRPGRARGPTSRTPARAAGRSRTRSTRTCPRR